VSRFNNIHLGLSHEEALRILTLPEGELDAASDYYMAASHLINFPGDTSEAALIALLKKPSRGQSIRLAQRKAVEVLGQLKAVQAIPVIGECLESDDIYLIENSAWALQQLNCQNQDIHQRLIKLLNDGSQNRRVIIQSLAGLNIKQAAENIRALIDDPQPGVRGAARAALAQLTEEREYLDSIEEHLVLPNQMDRQAAIQDIIDGRSLELLPSVLKAPVSPAFRFRALKALWPEQTRECMGQSLTVTIDALLMDEPDDLVLVHQYDQTPDHAFLLQEFFGTDFSRCYLALQTLEGQSADSIWPLIKQRWEEEAHNDYGAHYFFIHLFRKLVNWPDAARKEIENWLIDAADTRRPQFMKSKPAAILTLATVLPERCHQELERWGDPERTPFWESRYAALMAMEQLGLQPTHTEDPDPFVAAKIETFKG
jgi:bilin biosynthesis protein